MIRTAMVAAIALSLSGCIVARVGSDGAVTAWAIGAAKVERCDDGVCTVVSGGTLSQQAGSVLEGLVGFLRFLIPGV